jgi:hypothetical protein
MAGEDSGAAAQLRLLDELLGTLRGTPGAVAAALPPRRGVRAAAHEGAESGVAADRRRSSSTSTRTSISTSSTYNNLSSSSNNIDDAVASEESEDGSGGRRAAALGVRRRRQCVLGPEGLSPDPSIPASPASSALSASFSVSSPAVSRPGSPASSASPPGLGSRARRQGVLELGAGGSSSPVGAGGAAGSPGGLRLAGLDARGEGSDPFEAIRSGSLLQLRIWLAARCAAHRSHHGRRRAVNLVDRDTGRALLHEACLHGREDCVRELLSYQGACDRNKPTLLGRCSPLHLAAGAGHNNVVRVLCKAGADIAARNKLGETPLHVAANAVVAKTLIFAGADPFSRTKSGASPSQTAAMSDRADVYDALQAEVVRFRKCLFLCGVWARVRVGGVDEWTRPQLTDGLCRTHRARKEGGAAQPAGAPPDQGGRGRRSPRRARAGAGEAQGQGRLRRVARRKEEAAPQPRAPGAHH